MFVSACLYTQTNEALSYVDRHCWECWTTCAQVGRLSLSMHLHHTRRGWPSTAEENYRSLHHLAIQNGEYKTPDNDNETPVPAAPVHPRLWVTGRLHRAGLRNRRTIAEHLLVSLRLGFLRPSRVFLTCAGLMAWLALFEFLAFLASFPPVASWSWNLTHLSRSAWISIALAYGTVLRISETFP